MGRNWKPPENCGVPETTLLWPQIIVLFEIDKLVVEESQKIDIFQKNPDLD